MYANHTKQEHSFRSPYDALARAMQKQLCDILAEAGKTPCAGFPADPRLKAALPQFQVLLLSQKLKTKLGDYRPGQGKELPTITLFDIEGEPWRSVLITAIHELSHHVDTITRDKLAHDDIFYAIHRNLLFTSFNMGILSPEDVEKAKSRAQNGHKLSTMMKEYQPHPAKYRHGKLQMRLYNAYGIKDTLRQNGFIWNPIDAAWIKFIPSADLQQLRQTAQDGGVGASSIVVIASPAVITRLRKRVVVSGVTPDSVPTLQKYKFTLSTEGVGVAYKLLPIGQQTLPNPEYVAIKGLKGVQISFL